MQPRRGRCSKNYLPPTPFKLVSDKTAVPKLQRAGPYGVGIATPYNAALDNTLHSQRLRFIWVQVEDEIKPAKPAINAVVKSTRLNSNTIRSKKCRESCATVLHARDRKQHLLHMDGKVFWNSTIYSNPSNSFATCSGSGNCPFNSCGNVEVIR